MAMVLFKSYDLPAGMHAEISTLRKALTTELARILDFWMQHTIDKTNGGFYGSVANDNTANKDAAKGIVLNARILWTFSAASNFTVNKTYIPFAQRAFDYICDHFMDTLYSGVYWSVDATGNMCDGRKQLYGLAFCLYGMSEYYAATNNKAALAIAVNLYGLMEQYSYDNIHDGYLEAFSREWTALADQRLSDKDANEKKTMNTHLHIVEAYTNLYKYWPDAALKEKIAGLLQLFDKYFIDPNSYHLRLFFDEQWKEKPGVISYGHDIEASWLLLHCAETIQHKSFIDTYRRHAINITKAAMEGLDEDGGLWYEYNTVTNTMVAEKHWWPQTEALIGFINAFELTGIEHYLGQALKSWYFITAHLLDKEKGEWYWGINNDYSVMPLQDKAGFWKCPYHNARACMEVLKRTMPADNNLNTGQ